MCKLATSLHADQLEHIRKAGQVYAAAAATTATSINTHWYRYKRLVLAWFVDSTRLKNIAHVEKEWQGQAGETRAGCFLFLFMCVSLT